MTKPNEPEADNNIELLVADTTKMADPQFLDDLSATRRFLSYRLSKGGSVPPQALKSMGRLIGAFASDLHNFEQQARTADSWSKTWRFFHTSKQAKEAQSADA
jgi:hypothetical protein